MKKLLLLTGAFIGLTLCFSSCEKEECKVCAQVTYDNGTKISSEKEAEYCGDELDGKDDDDGETVGTLLTIWECN